MQSGGNLMKTTNIKRNFIIICSSFIITLSVFSNLNASHTPFDSHIDEPILSRPLPKYPLPNPYTGSPATIRLLSTATQAAIVIGAEIQASLFSPSKKPENFQLITKQQATQQQSFQHNFALDTPRVERQEKTTSSIGQPTLLSLSLGITSPHEKETRNSDNSVIIHKPDDTTPDTHFQSTHFQSAAQSGIATISYPCKPDTTSLSSSIKPTSSTNQSLTTTEKVTAEKATISAKTQPQKNLAFSSCSTPPPGSIPSESIDPSEEAEYQLLITRLKTNTEFDHSHPPLPPLIDQSKQTSSAFFSPKRQQDHISHDQMPPTPVAKRTRPLLKDIKPIAFDNDFSNSSLSLPTYSQPTGSCSTPPPGSAMPDISDIDFSVFSIPSSSTSQMMVTTPERHKTSSTSSYQVPPTPVAKRTNPLLHHNKKEKPAESRSSFHSSFDQSDIDEDSFLLGETKKKHQSATTVLHSEPSIYDTMDKTSPEYIEHMRFLRRIYLNHPAFAFTRKMEEEKRKAKEAQLAKIKQQENQRREEAIRRQQEAEQKILSEYEQNRLLSIHINELSSANRVEDIIKEMHAREYLNNDGNIGQEFLKLLPDMQEFILQHTLSALSKMKRYEQVLGIIETLIHLSTTKQLTYTRLFSDMQQTVIYHETFALSNIGNHDKSLEIMRNLGYLDENGNPGREFLIVAGNGRMLLSIMHALSGKELYEQVIRVAQQAKFIDEKFNLTYDFNQLSPEIQIGFCNIISQALQKQGLADQSQQLMQKATTIAQKRSVVANKGTMVSLDTVESNQ